MSAVQGANALYFLTEPLEQPSRLPAVRQYGVTDWSSQFLPKKPPQSAALKFEEYRIVHDTPASYLEHDLDEIQRTFIYATAAPVRIFLSSRRAIRATLLDSVPQLRISFGSECLFRLELPNDDDGYQTMYVVAIWSGSVQSAVHALRQFEETWWLDHMKPSTAELAFVYEIT